MNAQKTKRPILKILAVALAVLIVAVLALAGWWLANPYTAMPEVSPAFMPDSIVKVERSDWLIFEPRNEPIDTGLIIYPGGRVEPEAYAPAARSIAEQGILVVIPPMPFNLAVMAPNAAQEIIGRFAEIDHWAIGGHSLGGSMAARFASRHPDTVEGLVLWASYPAQADDLSGLPLNVISIYASEDQLATPQEILASEALLPADSRLLLIDGGNHAQFGWYGPQSGDGQAKISREAQQQIIIEATMELLEQISNGSTGQRGRISFIPGPIVPKARIQQAPWAFHVR
jgi:hypothetical protein